MTTPASALGPDRGGNTTAPTAGEPSVVRLLPGRVRPDPRRLLPPVWSASASWRDLVTTTPTRRGTPRAGWARNWTVTYRHDATEHTVEAGKVRAADLLTADPVRTGTWHRNVRARAGLLMLNEGSPGHWHESLFERDMLIALAYDGITALATQPFRLDWTDAAGRARHHTPDAILTRDRDVLLVNARPAERMTNSLLENTASLDALCVKHGWQQALITGFQRPAFTTISAAAAARHSHDPNGYAAAMLTALADDGPLEFHTLADRQEAPAHARAVLRRMIWDRSVSVDLNHLLGQSTVVTLPVPAR